MFQAIFETNVLAMVATFEPFIAGMRQARRGTLVGIGSVAGVRGLPGAGAYSASKSAVATYCESLRLELARDGVRVVTIAPGYVRTALTQALHQDGEFDAWLRARTPAGRWAEPEDLASAMVFLAARESGYVTGQVLAVDGGLTASM